MMVGLYEHLMGQLNIAHTSLRIRPARIKIACTCIRFAMIMK